jgi:ferredoxin
MAYELSRRGASWEAHYAAGSRSAAAYLAELTALNPAVVHTHLRDENGPRSLKIASVIAEAPPGAHFYCCGPVPMLDDFAEATREIDGGRVHQERFQGADEASAAGAAAGQAGGFTVELARAGKTLHVADGQTILDAVLDAGINVPFSCREGICGTCRTRVLAGEPDHKDFVLSAAERAAGNVMQICVSRSKGDLLVLDI